MTRSWKAVLLITLIVPIMLLVGAFGLYAMAQTRRSEVARQQLLRERDLIQKQQESLDLRLAAPAGDTLVRDDAGESRLEELRQKAELAERRSIERANDIRERLKQSEGVGDAEVKKALRAELRVVVLEAFKARHDLHAAEVASLERQAQAMKRKLVEREASSSDIVGRRVDELLNPDKQWNVESPAANVPNRKTTAAEPPSGDEDKLVISRSETSVKVEGQFDGNEEVLLVIGDPRLTEPRATSPSLPAAKELKWASPIDKAGKYAIEVRSEPVKIDGGGMAPGLVFQVHNQPNTVQATSYISFTDKDPLPNGKVVIAVPQNKVIAKRKSSQVLVTVGHVELPDNPTVVPINIVIRRKATMTSKTAIEQPAAAKSEDKQLGTVLGKPIHESDLNKNTSTGDNLRQLLLAPLTENYCAKHGLNRAEELNAKIKDDNSRRVVRLFVSWWELNRHLYEKHGGRVQVALFGSVAFDGMRKWLDEREQAGDFEITDPQLKTVLSELYNQIPPGTMFAKPDQLKTAFDLASTDRFIEIYAKIPGVENAAKETSDGAIRTDDAMNRLIDIMGRLLEKRDAHTLEVRSLKDEAERQSRSGEFPPIQNELDELVALESAFRGQPSGCLAVVHLCVLASSYSGTERPVHQALDTVLVHLDKYGHLKDLAIAFDRLVAHDGLNTGDALTRLIEAKCTLPFVRESARLCKARWQLEMVANRDITVRGLEELTNPTEITRTQAYLKKSYPSATDSEQWKLGAISELDALGAGATEHHVSVTKAVDPKGIFLTEDSERTAEGPTIAALAKGLSFRAKHLTTGSEAPKLDVKLVAGDRWVLRDQAPKLAIVQFSFKGCGPCERMYPVLRDIVRDHPGKVSVLSVMADTNVETTQEAVESGKMTWGVTWDGASGPIATEWGIRKFPSVFLFDADKKCLGSDIQAEYLEEVVKALLRRNANR